MNLPGPLSLSPALAAPPLDAAPALNDAGAALDTGKSTAIQGFASLLAAQVQTAADPAALVEPAVPGTAGTALPSGGKPLPVIAARAIPIAAQMPEGEAPAPVPTAEQAMPTLGRLHELAARAFRAGRAEVSPAAAQAPEPAEQAGDDGADDPVGDPAAPAAAAIGLPELVALSLAPAAAGEPSAHGGSTPAAALPQAARAQLPTVQAPPQPAAPAAPAPQVAAAAVQAAPPQTVDGPRHSVQRLAELARAPAVETGAVRTEPVPAAPDGSLPGIPVTAAPAADPALAALSAAAPPGSSAQAAPTAGPASTPVQASDLTQVVEAIARARAEARPETAQLTVRHAEFGPVSLRFEQGGGDLTVALSSPDPDFTRAVSAATASERAGSASDGAAARDQSAPQRGFAQDRGPGEQAPRQHQHSASQPDRAAIRANPAPRGEAGGTTDSPGIFA